MVIEPQFKLYPVPILGGSEPVQEGPLANFGTVNFTNFHYTDIGGGAYPQYISDYEAQTPPETSVGSNVSNWTVTWENPGHYLPNP